MSILGSTLDLIVKNPNLNATMGARFNFGTGTRRVVKGFVPFTDGAGNTWDALGEFGSVSGLSLGYGDVTEPMVFELSGLSAQFMSIAVNQKEELKGRECATYLIVFDEDWTLAAEPVALRTAIMDNMVRRYDAQSRLVGITLTAESFQVTRFRAPNSYLTHADQQARFPGDDGLERLSGYAGPVRVLYWG